MAAWLQVSLLSGFSTKKTSRTAHAAIALVPEVLLIHKLLNMHNHMHHHVEALNAVVKVETTFLEHFAPNTPSIQLCEGVSSPAPNETVAVIILGQGLSTSPHCSQKPVQYMYTRVRHLPMKCCIVHCTIQWLHHSAHSQGSSFSSWAMPTSMSPAGATGAGVKMLLSFGPFHMPVNQNITDAAPSLLLPPPTIENKPNCMCVSKRLHSSQRLSVTA